MRCARAHRSKARVKHDRQNVLGARQNMPGASERKYSGVARGSNDSNGSADSSARAIIIPSMSATRLRFAAMLAGPGTVPCARSLSSGSAFSACGRCSRCHWPLRGRAAWECTSRRPRWRRRRSLTAPAVNALSQEAPARTVAFPRIWSATNTDYPGRVPEHRGVGQQTYLTSSSPSTASTGKSSMKR